MDVITFIGIAGATILLIAFIANEFGKLNVSSLVYDLLNFLGAGLLAWYAILIDSIPFLILEAVWAAVALRDVTKRVL